MRKKTGDMWDILASIGYDNFYEIESGYCYDDMKPNSIERKIWREIAMKIIDKYKEMGGK